MPVHQPPDREDDKDQPEYAANPDGSALPVTARDVLEVNRMVEALKPKEQRP